MALYSIKPLEHEDFDHVQPLGSDRSIFNQLEEKWRNLRAVRRFILLPLTVLGSIFPFVYVAIWSNITHVLPNRDIQWWLWVLIAVAFGGLWLYGASRPYYYVKKREEQYDEALDALDALDYENQYLVQLTTGRRLSQFNNLKPLSFEGMTAYTKQSTDAGPLTLKMWQRWVQQDTPIRVCDLFLLEKMILKEKWSATP